MKDNILWLEENRVCFEQRGRIRKLLLMPHELEEAKRIVENGNEWAMNDYIYRIA